MLKQEGRSKRGHIVVEEKEEKKLHRRSFFPPKHAVAPPHSHTQPRSPCFSFSLLWAHFQHQHRRGRTFPTLPDLDKSCEMDDATPAHRHLTHRFRLRNFYDRKVGKLLRQSSSWKAQIWLVKWSRMDLIRNYGREPSNVHFERRMRIE